MTEASSDEKPRAGSSARELTWRRVERDLDTMVEIAPGVHVQQPMTAQAEDDGVTWEMDVEYADGRLVCGRLEARRHEGGPPITSELLRSLAVGRALYSIVTKEVVVYPKTFDPFASGQRVSELLANGPTDEALLYVAQVYTIAYACGLKPTQAVVELGLTRSTAERW